MAVVEDIEFVGRLLDDYASQAWRKSVAVPGSKVRGVPPEMQVGNVDDEGWVEWRVLPSTLKAADITAVENEFGVQFPPVFRAYLLARFHLFDDVQSRRYEQQVFMTDTPAGRPLKPLRELLLHWRPLIDAGFIPFAEWGDGWGPMCFDADQRRQDGECPIVWMDHELLVPIKDFRDRAAVLPLVQPLYDSCREFLIDVFGRG